MDTRSEIREFLTSRRARITPDQVGLASYGPRRVPGLRREEVAVLAGVSVPYYTRLERGDMNGVSASVLVALARALQLDDAERAHLLDLARAAHPMPSRPRRRQARQSVRPEVQWTLDAITGAAAFVSNERLDILAANQLGRALYSELYDAPGRPVNTARFVFLDPRAEMSYGDWDRIATETVAILGSHGPRRRAGARGRSELMPGATRSLEALRPQHEPSRRVRVCIQCARVAEPAWIVDLAQRERGGGGMNIEFLATVAVIAPDPPVSRKLYVDVLGLPLESQGGDYHHSEQIDGCKSFGIWPLSQAAEACFGTPQWPSERLVPQVSIEFDVADAAAVGPAARELEQAGYELLHPPRKEPWGQTVARLQSPEGAVVGISYTPVLHEQD